MSTSRKRSATARGKSPAIAQNKEPNIPRPTLIPLGVLDGVTKLFHNIEWENLLNLLAHTYHLLTSEFLADCGLDNERKKVAFQHMGEPMHINFARVNDILSLPSSNTFVDFDSLPPKFNHKNFWIEITSGFFSCAGHNIATSIIHPCLRIAHRILMCTIFSHKEVVQVTKIEIFFLWCMTRHENPSILDFASFFFYKCALMKTKATGDICIGVFVTLLAQDLDIKLLDDYSP
ncbi:unnamed protein product [Lactuca saligna]|uniref:Arabidopsis retrotransposon Orf1 C-terminal domain-containing protein n=1 Tax=Lactuca saligna TaxID=75948 RepID=A0AA35YNW6_LACSI|nr:unnamed protein product [Lactuca saligna]